MSLDDGDFSLGNCVRHGQGGECSDSSSCLGFSRDGGHGACKPGRSLPFLERLPKAVRDDAGTAHDLLPDLHGRVYIPRVVGLTGQMVTWLLRVSHRVDGSSEYYGFLHCIWAYSFRPCILLLTRKEHWDPALCADNADYARDGVLRLEPGIIFALARVDRSLRPELCGVPVG